MFVFFDQNIYFIHFRAADLVYASTVSFIINFKINLLYFTDFMRPCTFHKTSSVLTEGQFCAFIF